MHRIFVTAFLSLTLASCSGGPAEQPAGSVEVAPGVQLTLPRPSELGRNLEVAQLVTAQYGESTFTFEGHISTTRDRLLLVGLDAMGRKALSVNWSDAGLKAETAPWLPEQVRPKNMIADMVLLYWPEDTVRRSLGPDATLTVAPHSRSVLSAGREVFHASYSGNDPWKGSVKYRNLMWNYELQVESIEVTP